MCLPLLEAARSSCHKLDTCFNSTQVSCTRTQCLCKLTVLACPSWKHGNLRFSVLVWNPSVSGASVCGSGTLQCVGLDRFNVRAWNQALCLMSPTLKRPGDLLLLRDFMHLQKVLLSSVFEWSQLLSLLCSNSASVMGDRRVKGFGVCF